MTGDTTLAELCSSSSSDVMLGDEHDDDVDDVVTGGGEVLNDLKLDSSLDESSAFVGVLAEAARMLSMPKGRKDALLVDFMLKLRMFSALEPSLYELAAGSGHLRWFPVCHLI